ncbi:hypothetical protein L1887_01581 [Cichorium endivia]|nr:hypothetical protein L1887_01581 [Cichorium endivia]
MVILVSMERETDGWRTVEHRRRNRPEFPGTILMFVANISDGVRKSELWKTFGKYGEIADVYIAGKKDANKKNFAFVRFKKSRLVLGPPPPPPNPKPISLTVDSSMADWISNELSYIGVAHSMEHLNTISPELTIGDDEGFEIKRCDGVEDQLERTAWIRIMGVPVNLWRRDNFSAIAPRFGRILISFDTVVDACDLSQGCVCILTDNFKRIEEVLMVEAEGRLSKVGVFEMDDYWFPLKSDTIFDDSDDDGNNILEECEIPSDGDDDGNNILEEGEIPSDVAGVEVVMESVFESGDESGGQTDAVTSGDASEPFRNMEGQHGNFQQTEVLTPIINDQGVISNVSVNGNSIPHTRGMECQMEVNILEPPSHAFGPDVAEAQIRGTIPAGVDVNSPNDSVNELVRTVEIGQAVGFQIEGGNEILAAILDESGEIIGNQ